MKPFTNILVDVDAMAASQPALDRAAAVARATGAGLRIVDVRPDFGGSWRGLDAEMEDETMTGRQARLEHLAGAVRDLSVETGLLAGPPADALIHDVLRFNHDLIVRSHTRDLVDDRPAQFGNVNTDLIRNCPCPVWAIGHGMPPPHPKIVAAVDASVEDSVKHRLNAKVMELAVVLAILLTGTATLLYAWQPFSEKRARYHGTSAQFSAYLNRARLRAEQDLTSLAGRYKVNNDAVALELRRGEVRVVLPQFVVSEGVDVVVVGSLGRRSLASRLKRSTAERLIERIPCSVMVVKPDEFVSSVRLGRSA